jgi:hypothetical protein
MITQNSAYQTEVLSPPSFIYIFVMCHLIHQGVCSHGEDQNLPFFITAN